MILRRAPSLFLIYALGCLFPLLPGESAATVWIHEFMASNGGTISDEEGDFEDWIELYNYGDAPVELQGWGLSDNPAQPFKWTFQSQRVLGPGEFLLVWASGKDRTGAPPDPEPALAPDAIEGIVLWLRAANAEAEDGAPVAHWPDASGRRNHAVQPNTTQRPVLVGDGLNGRPVLRFDRASAQQFFLPPADIEGLGDFSDFTVLSLARWTGGVQSGLFGGYRGGNRANVGSSVFEIADSGGRLRLRLPPGIDLAAPNSVQINQWHLLGASRDAASGEARLFRDGEIMAAGAGEVGRTVLADYERVPVASSHDDNRTFGGDMAEMMVFNRSLSETELGLIEAYISNHYGLAAAPEQFRPHTNFRMAADGEPLRLTRPDGSVADFVPAVAVPRGLSYGRTGANSERWAYFYEPTPEAPNTTAAFADLIGPVVFSHPAGSYEAGFSLTIDHLDPDVTVVYTLDGSEPDMENLGGTTYSYMNSYSSGPLLEQQYASFLYEGPLVVQDRSGEPNKLARISSTTSSNPGYLPTTPVKKGTVVRARPYVNGVPGPVTTATYFVSESGAFDYGLPIISLSVNEDELFDFFDGIYVAGIDHVTGSGGRICNWANYNRRGGETEGRGHVEFFRGGARFLEQAAGVRIQGNCSRQNPFKSLRLYARGESLDEGTTFDFPFFTYPATGAVHPDNTNHRRLMMRAPNFNDTVFSRLFHGVYEGVAGRLQPAKQFINGEYWGLVFLRDRFDPSYLHYNYGLDPDNVTIIGIAYRHEFESIPITFGSRVYALSSGIPDDMADFEAMRTYVVGNDMAIPSFYSGARERICIDSFIDHLILKIFAGDDHYAPEVVYWRTREPENDGYGDGRWRFLVKDFDSTLRTDNYVAGLANGTHPRPFGHELFTSLLANEGFRRQFVNRFSDLLNTHFVTERFQEIIHRSYDEVAPYWAEVSARWNQAALSNPNRPFTTNTRRDLLNWSVDHPDRQRGHLRNYFSLMPQVELTVAVNQLSGGRVRLNSVVLEGGTPGVATEAYPWTGLYFPSYPVELEAIPEAGYRLVEWRITPADGLTTTATDSVVSVDLHGATTVEAVFEPIPLAAVAMDMHRWDFEDPFGFLPPAFTLGGGSLTVDVAPGGEAVRNVAAQGFSSPHLRVNQPLGAILTLAVPTTGYESIAVDFQTNRSGQGAGAQVLSYTLNGLSWTEFETYPTFNDPPLGRHFDFSAVAGAADNPLFALRIEFLPGEGGTGGNNRFDDIVVSGVSLPGRKRPPLVREEAPLFLEVVAGRPHAFHPNEWFADLEGKTLVFSALTADKTLLSGAVEGDKLILLGFAAGETILTVSASDGASAPMPHPVRVLVHAQPSRLAFGHHQFSEWSADEPAGRYPPHMLFVQSGRDDPGLEDPLRFAYRIPAWDAANIGDVDFPYNASSRTRISGLGPEGVAFINTGRGRDLGAVILTLDTTGAEDIQVTWTGGTVESNSRAYGLRLQYRVGLEETWGDVMHENEPVAYYRNELDGHSEVIGPVALPPGTAGAPLVQLRWIYHHVEGTSGARPKLRLDDVRVESTANWGSLPTFLPAGDGEWAEDANWTGGVYPDGPGSWAFVPAPAEGGRVIGVSQPVTVGNLVVETGASPYRTLLHGGGAGHRLTFDGGSREAVLHVANTEAGYVELENEDGAELATDLRIIIAHGNEDPAFDALRLGGRWAGPGGLIKEGDGLLSLAGESDPDQAMDRLAVLQGGVRVDGAYPVPVRLAAAGHLTGTGTVGQISGAGRVVLRGGGLTARSLLGPSLTAFFEQVGADGNGLLRLTDASPLGAAPPRIDQIVGAANLVPGDRLRGALFVAAGLDLAHALAAADVRLFVPDADGSHSFFDGRYREADASDALSWRIATDAVLFGDGPATGNVMEIVRGGAPGTFAQWAGLEIDDPVRRVDPAFAAPGADPFGTGLPNLLRYALGLGWAESSADRLPVIRLSTDGLTLRFPFNPALMDIIYRVYASLDLLDWSTILFDSEQAVAPTLEDGWLVLPLPTADRMYFRIGIHPR